MFMPKGLAGSDSRSKDSKMKKSVFYIITVFPIIRVTESTCANAILRRLYEKKGKQILFIYCRVYLWLNSVCTHQYFKKKYNENRFGYMDEGNKLVNLLCSFPPRFDCRKTIKLKKKLWSHGAEKREGEKSPQKRPRAEKKGTCKRKANSCVISSFWFCAASRINICSALKGYKDLLL